MPKNVNLFTFIILSLSTVLFSIASITIVPFVMIYTENVNDANYYQPVFSFLLVFFQMIFTYRMLYYYIPLAAGHFEEKGE